MPKLEHKGVYILIGGNYNNATGNVSLELKTLFPN